MSLFTRFFNGISNAAQSLGASVYWLGSSAKQAFIDRPFEKKADAIGAKASELVSQRIQHALYGDPERYGVVRGTNQQVDIYFKNSPILNNLMKSATGYTIDDFINSLPMGVKQAAAPLRTYLENMLARMLVEKLSEVSVKKATVAALLASKNYTEAQISAYLNTYCKDEPIDPAIQKLINERSVQEK